MKKWNVTVNFNIQAEDRGQAWLEAAKVCEKHLRDLANIERISEVELLDASKIIAINEPIRRMRAGKPEPLMLTKRGQELLGS